MMSILSLCPLPTLFFIFFLLADCTGRAARLLSWSREGVLCILFSFQVVVATPVSLSALPSVGPGCSVTLGVDFKSISSAVSGA